MCKLIATIRKKPAGLSVLWTHFLMAVLIATMGAGCSTVGEAINPYGSSFNCKMTENGKCITMTGAYRESLLPGRPKDDKKQKSRGNDIRDTQETQVTYQDSLYRKLSGLLEEPETPMIAPPKVMRVLLLPYKGTDKELFMYRYAYFLVDDYSWVLGDNIVTGGK